MFTREDWAVCMFGGVYAHLSVWLFTLVFVHLFGGQIVCLISSKAWLRLDRGTLAHGKGLDDGCDASTGCDSSCHVRRVKRAHQETW